MKRIFIDSSVLFSALYSDRGHSSDLLKMAVRKEIVLVLNDVVLEESRRNLARYGQELVAYFDLIVESIPYEVVELTQEEIIEAARRVVLKDAPILAAARKAKADLLVSLDKKHLLGKPELAAFAGVEIVTPLEAIAYLRKSN